MFNPERRDKIIRDSKEKEPNTSENRQESPEVGKDESINTKETLQTGHTGIQISAENAHAVGVRMIQDQIMKTLLKELVAERLAKKENLTRADRAISDISSDEYYQLYGITHEHLVKIDQKNFLFFDLVPDGDDVAISFLRNSGDAALRPLDNDVLAHLLKQALLMMPDQKNDFIVGISQK